MLNRFLKYVHRKNVESEKDMRHPVPLVIGEQGVGKSAIIKQTAEELSEDQDDFGWVKLNGAMLQHPADVFGFPETDEEEGTTKHLPHDWFKKVLSYDKGIFFIDEFLRAEPPAQDALYDFILWGELGDYEVPDDWTIVCASNPPTQDFHVETMDQALVDRFVVYPYAGNRQNWFDWAVDQGDVSDDIIAYYKNNPDLVTLNEPEIPFEIEPTHRSLEMLDILYERNMDKDILHAIISGTIGEENFKSFNDFRKTQDFGVSAEEVIQDWHNIKPEVEHLNDEKGVEMQILKPLSDNIVSEVKRRDENDEDLNQYRKNIIEYLKFLPQELKEDTFSEIADVDADIVKDEELIDSVID